MKDYLRELLKTANNQGHARFIMREYLQARTLQMIQDSFAFTNWAFLGGTALRFIYNMPRFSEDLDFSLISKSEQDSFREVLKAIKNGFEAEDYDITLKVKDKKNVKSAFIRFNGLVSELGLSPQQAETLAIKVEIDTNPPAGADSITTIVRKYGLINLHHYDQASLLAGKLHAILTRRYTKGRDIYDLMWYLSDRSWPGPNLIFLNNALEQSDFPGLKLSAGNWCEEVYSALEKKNWADIVTDVQVFLERPEDIKLLTKENIQNLLTRR